MSFIQTFKEFLQSVFMASSPEVKKRQALRKIENTLRVSTPAIYKGGVVLENFAEALRVLSINAKPLHELLSQTMCSDNYDRNAHFTEQLLLTGLPPEIQDILESLSYDNRKASARDADSLSRHFESEHRQLEKVLKYFNMPDFVRIDNVIDRIKQLNDLCKYSFVTALRLFDVGFSTAPNYTPNFQALPAELLDSSLCDLYYVCCDLDINTSTSNAIIALYQLYHKTTGENEETAALVENLKKIQSVLRHVLTNETLKNLICLAKKDPTYVPKKAIYNENARKHYGEFLENRFRIEEARLKNDLQDEKISDELKQIFSDKKMVAVAGYNTELNEQLKTSPLSFTYCMPFQILKSFLTHYFEAHVKPLLNDIVIEGYFNNSAYKTEFSSAVYALNEALDRLKEFEDSFSRNKDFDEAVLLNLLSDARKNNNFNGRIKDMVDKINRIAKDIIQIEVNNIFHVYKLLGEIIVEAKKTHSDVITNLKVLTLSSRNRDNAELLEKQYSLWALFLEIMKNYVIITNTEKK